MTEFSDYTHCRLCPRECGIDRQAGNTGFCGQTADCRVADILPHFGEEPPISGTRGSGTIFFTGCACGCFFCQNHQISSGHIGAQQSLDQLWHRIRDLLECKVHTLNFVTPTHFWPHVRHICNRLRTHAISIPTVFNGSGFHRAELVPEYAEHIDIFLPDIKYADPDLAENCMGRRDYFDHALATLKKMVELKGFLEPFDDSDNANTAKSGVLVRHLVLPGHIDNTLTLLRTLRYEFGRMLPISLMSQYHPTPRCTNHDAEFNRRLHAEEYRRATEEVAALDFQQLFVQENFGDSDFLPDFEQHTPFKGNALHDLAKSRSNHHVTP